MQVLRKVTLPLLAPAVAAAALLVFIFDFTSFGVILVLGGPRFATLEVEIYNQTVSLFNLPLAGRVGVNPTVLYPAADDRLHPPGCPGYRPLSLRPQRFTLRRPDHDTPAPAGSSIYRLARPFIGGPIDCTGSSFGDTRRIQHPATARAI